MNTKKAFMSGLLLLGLLSVSSCSNEESAGLLESNMKSVMPTTIESRVISKSEIPEEAKIFVVNNEEEDKALTERMAKEKVCFVFRTDDNAAKRETIPYLLKGLEKMANPESGSVGSGWYVTIKVDLIYYGTRDPITVNSSAYIVGESDYIIESWTQTASSAMWTNSFTAINYYVAGTAVLIYYIYNPEKKTYEIKKTTRDVSYSGTQYI